MDSVSDSDGTTPPNRYISLSLVIILLKQENQKKTLASITAAAAPYKADSSVSGFPPGKYASIVTPSWLKATLNTADITITGARTAKSVKAARRPPSITEYAKPQQKDNARHTGFIKIIENPITAAKYIKLTVG